MKTHYIILLSFITLSCFGQNTPVMSKITADWCSNCGTWGWEYMEGLKEEFTDGPAMVLGVHYSGGLKNPTAEWWGSNLGSVGQPRFYIDNTRLTVNSANWDDVIPTTVEMAQDIANQVSAVDFSYTSIIMENGSLEVIVNVTEVPSGSIHLGNYVYEDNLVAFQSRQGNDAVHPNVLRSTMGPDFSGLAITEEGEYSFTMDIPAEWNQEELGLLTVVWTKNGDDFEIIASESVDDLTQPLSSSDDLLDETLFTYADGADNLIITTDLNEDFQLSISDTQGRRVLQSHFSGKAILDKSTIISGIYVISIQNESGRTTKKMFLR